VRTRTTLWRPADFNGAQNLASHISSGTEKTSLRSALAAVPKAAPAALSLEFEPILEDQSLEEFCRSTIAISRL